MATIADTPFRYYQSLLHQGSDKRVTEHVLIPFLFSTLLISTINELTSSNPKSNSGVTFYKRTVAVTPAEPCLNQPYEHSSSATTVKVRHSTMDYPYEDSNNVKSPIIMSGWLQKMKRRARGNYSTDWNKRWITIQNQAISWRHSKDSDVVSGSIDIQYITDVYKIPALNKKKRKKTSKKNNSLIKNEENNSKVFMIKSSRKRRVLCLMAKNEGECEKWVRAIQIQLDLRDGGTSLGPPSSTGNAMRNKPKGSGDRYDLMMRKLERSMSSLSQMSIDVPSKGNRSPVSSIFSPSDLLTPEDQQRDRLHSDTAISRMTDITGSVSETKDFSIPSHLPPLQQDIFEEGDSDDNYGCDFQRVDSGSILGNGRHPFNGSEDYNSDSDIESIVLEY